MEESLFGKYSKLINKKKEDKQIIIDLIYLSSGIKILEKEIIIKGKVVSFNISSTKRSIFLIKKIEEKFKEKGYIISF